MRPRISKRLRSGNPLATLAVLGLRWAGTTGWGRRLGPAFYRRRARAVAAELARLDGVQGVYLTGSSLGGAVLGYSDIDLMLVVELPTLERELRLRRALRDVLRRRNRPIELFPHIDYVEASDLELLRQRGHAFSLRLDSDWQLLCGHDHRRSPIGSSTRHAELANAVSAMRYWTSQSSLLIDPRSFQDSVWHARMCRRLLGGSLAAWLGVDRRSALAELIEAVNEAGAGETIARLARNPPPPVSARAHTPEAGRELVAASLEVLDVLSTRTFPEFGQRWPDVLHPPAPVSWPNGERLAELAVAGGFSRAEVATTTPHDRQRVALVTSAPRWSAVEAVSRLGALCARLGPLPTPLFNRATLPVLLTPSMRRAAVLLDPSPLLAVGLAAQTASLGGEANPAPTPSDLDCLTTISLAALFVQPRGRALRVWRSREQGLASMAREVLDIAPELVALADGRAVDFSPRAAPVRDEDMLVERLRALLDELRPRLHTKLESR